MKEIIADTLLQSFVACQQAGTIPADLTPNIQVDRARDKSHGDFATNLAMTLAKPAQKKPRDIAEALVANLPVSEVIEKVEIAGPGFINFYLRADAQFSVIPEVLSRGELYGRCDLGKNKSIQIEFVSANPTGPLHVGFGVASDAHRDHRA